MDVTWNGKTYKEADDLGEAVFGDLEGITDPWKTKGTLGTAFVNKYNQIANNTTAMNDPVVKSLVTALSTDILNIAGSVQRSIDIIDGGAAPSTLNDLMASEITTTDSDGIAALGSK